MNIFMEEKNNFKSFLLTSDAIWKISSWSHDIPFFSAVFLPNHAQTIPIRSSLEFIFTFIGFRIEKRSRKTSRDWIENRIEE